MPDSLMTASPDFLLALLAMGLASYACRAGGFFLMRFVTVTPRIESALKVLPLGVMIGIVMPAVTKGGPPEWCGVLAVIAMMKLSGNDFVAAFAGIATVALLRQL